MIISRKGSLNLSINAIVVLILAITLLGLGLSFIRNIFGGATDKLSEALNMLDEEAITTFKSKCTDDFCVQNKLILSNSDKKPVMAAIFNKFDCPISQGPGSSVGAVIMVETEKCKAIGADTCEGIIVNFLDEQAVDPKQKVMIPIVVETKSTVETGVYRFPVTVEGSCTDTTYNIEKTLYFDVEVK